jgi:hypothetical protein
MKNSILFYIFIVIIITIIIVLYLLYYKSNNKKIENFLIPYRNVFNYTGTIQTFTIPTGVTSVNIYCWGAGGGGSRNNEGWGPNGYGGNGGFVSATLTIPSGTASFKVIVGQGGRKGVTQSSSGTAYGGGGAGSGNDSGWAQGSGGGLSGVFIDDANMTVSSGVVNSSATAIIIAGGGGGAGADRTNSTAKDGGNAGGLVGNDGSNVARCGKGGTQTAGGNAGDGSTPPDSKAGSKYKGGTSTFYGAGGGAGWFGGGSGRYSINNDVPAGGGGSSYLNTGSYSLTNINFPSAQTNGTRTAPGNTNSYYQTGVALGAERGLYDGGNGLVVIEYMDYSPEERAALGRKNAILNSIRESAEAYNSELTSQTTSLEITSELQKYPTGILDPSSVSSTPQTLNRNLRFGNQEYEIAFTSFDNQNRNNTPLKLFNGNIDNSAIIDSDNPNSDLIGGSFSSDRDSGYDLTSGNYIGQKRLTINGTQISGEGLYIKAPSAFIIRKYGFVALTGNENYAPGKWMLFGTNATIDPAGNNIQATLIDDATGSQLSRVNYLNKYSWYLKTIPAPTPPTGFTTYLFIFTATARSDLNISEYDYNKLNFSEITIYGHPPATTTS